MAIKALIFDMDGTLVDSNGAHALAWQKSFGEQGFEVSLERINEEIGKGGDHLVESILGSKADQERGEQLRKGHTGHFLSEMNSGSTLVFEGARELVGHAKVLGLQTALASSSKEEEMEAIEKSSGVGWRELFDVVVSSSDVEASKPSPDSVVVAVQKLGLSPSECLFIGDTIYDAKASLQAGVAMVGVQTGPFSTTADKRLREAGAVRTYENTAEILANFDEVLNLV